MRFEYSALGYEYCTVVSIAFVKPSKGYSAYIGRLIFNDPDEHREQYELWKTTMKWSPMHVLMTDLEKTSAKT